MRTISQPQTLPKVGQIDPRFQSYNVEMAEVVGARFWAPYNSDGANPAERYRLRNPLDLKGNVRLVNLAKALGPAYMRISGTWANSTYFQDDDNPPLTTPPAGYKGVLTRAQWQGVVAFSKAVDAPIVLSFPVSDGARNPDSSWNPEGTRRLLRYTRKLGGTIAAVQPINEPNAGIGADLPRGYSPAAFARDGFAFKALVESELPGVKIAGPTGTGDAGNYLSKGRPSLIQFRTKDLMDAAPPRYDIFAYHSYTSSSQRCVTTRAAKPDVAVTEEWLSTVDTAFKFYSGMRDQYAPGAPIWITEIAEAACGGDPWASTYADSFRYVDNMGRLAKQGVSAIFHNTLAASDYALIDDVTWQPRPNYWAALLWRRVMGETVLDAGPLEEGLHVYAHCLRGKFGGVALAALNLDRAQPATIILPLASERYTLTAGEFVGRSVELNGRTLTMAGDHLPPVRPAAAAKGAISLPAASITFLTLPAANNPACRATR